MSWLEIALVLAVLVGAGAGTALVVRNPAFWVGLGSAMLQGLLPVLTRRMDPETERRWRECQLRGGRWNHRTRRCD